MPFARFGGASTYTGPAGGAGSAGTAGTMSRNAGAIGPAALVTFTTGNIVSTKTGLYLVIGKLAANCSGVSTQAGQLLMDGATVLDICIAGTGGAGPFWLGFVAIVQVAALSTHTFAVNSQASAGTNTIPIQDAGVTVEEF